MKAEFLINGKIVRVNLAEPIDISLPLGPENSASAWYVSPVKIEPVRAAGFTGSIKEGGNVNFRNVFFNPHGNGTHTECVGHISPEVYSLNQHLKTFFFNALLISVEPETVTNVDGTSAPGDRIITLQQVKKALGSHHPQALIIRTRPNLPAKKTCNYSHANPAYLHHEAAKFITESGIDHLLLDLPSVDREDDKGQLLAHKAFWNYPQNTQFHKTITEMVYVPDEVQDGIYLLNLMVTSLENDASPSKPVLYREDR